jgi:TolB-like protein
VLSFAEELKRGDYKPAVRVWKPVTPVPVAAPEVGLPSPVASDAPVSRVSAPTAAEAPRRWSRSASFAAFAFAALLLMVFVIRSLTSSPPNAKQIVVAVFDNLTGDKALDPLGMLAADYVVRALDNSTFTVVDTRTSALAARWLASSSPAGGSESDRAAALASETRSGTVITGHYYRQGDTLQFEANIIDAARGVTLHSVGFRGAAADENKLVAELAGRVSARLVSSSDTTAGAATAQLVEAPSIEALEHATRAWERFFTQPFDTTAAFEELRQAIALDSSYTTPFLMRGYILDVKARWEDLSEVVAHLGPHRSRMGRVERAALALFESDLKGDLLGRLHASHELARLSPGSPDMSLLVAISAMYINRGAEARASLLRTRTDRGINQVSPMYWAWRAASDHALDRFDDELTSGKQELKLFPNSQTALLAFTRAYAAQGNVTALDALLLKVGLTPQGARPEAMNLALLAGRELRAHGHATEAQKLFARLAAIPLRAGATPVELGHHALAQYEAGDYRGAHAVFSALAQRDSTDIGLLGRAAASAYRVGDTASVRFFQGRLTTWSRPFAMGEHTFWLAHLAVVAGHGHEAVLLLHHAITQGYRPMDLGTITLHEDGDFAPLWKDSAFQALVRQQDGPPVLP